MGRVVVLGSSGFDLTIHLPRLPVVGETLIGGDLQSGPGGKGANAAVAARRAGADVSLITAFGDDAFGRQAAAALEVEGVDLSGAKVVPDAPNQVALIFVDRAGRNLIGVAPGASPHLRPEDIDRLAASAFRPGDVLLACLEVPTPTVARGLALAKAAGLTTVLNPAPADRAVLDGAILASVDYLTPNEEEARVLSGWAVDSPAGARGAARWLRDRGAGTILLTLGAGGALAFDGSSAILVPTPDVAAVDTVGAGDVFNGCFAAGLAEGLSPIEAAERACIAGALATTRRGAQASPRRAEIEAAFQSPNRPRARVLP